MPLDGRVRVLIYTDKESKEISDGISKTAREFGVSRVGFIRGKGTFLGDEAGADRKVARENYESRIERIASRIRGHDARGAWKRFRDSRVPALDAIKKEELDALQSIAKWNEAEHPRHPAGAPASQGGEFARKNSALAGTPSKKLKYETHKVWKIKSAGEKPREITSAQKRKLIELAKSYQPERMEQVGFVRPDGSLLAERSGDESGVSIDAMTSARVWADGQKASGTGDSIVSIHNHPAIEDKKNGLDLSPYPPSLSDLRSMISMNLGECRVVTHNGTIYRLMRGPDGFPNANLLNQAGMKIEKEITREVNQYIFNEREADPYFKMLKARPQTRASYSVLLQHMRLVRLAQELPKNFYYERIDP
jgi:hypothetical protein